ncbi:MAG: Gmad2 immunoglobulin-like domain-containing protein [Acidimicrobiia bacterium]
MANHRAYLYRSVLNEATSHHRSTMRRRLREARAASPEVAPAVEVDLDVLAAVDRLTVRQRAAIVLTYWEDLVFEATVQYEVTTLDGDVLAAGFTAASCGSGCWGSLGVSVEFDIERETEGLVTVYAESAADGTRQDVVDHRVTLTP